MVRTNTRARGPQTRHLGGRDRRLWLSARALVLKSGSEKGPLAIRDMRRVLTASGGLASKFNTRTFVPRERAAKL
jgi:hypothetical protein